jgi:hypothetical protein
MKREKAVPLPTHNAVGLLQEPATFLAAFNPAANSKDDPSANAL